MSDTRRRWFAFRVRTLLFVIVPLCALAGWWGNSTRAWIRRRHEVLADHVVHWQSVNKAMEKVSAPWPLPLFGEDGIGAFTFYAQDTEAEIDAVGRLFPESEINVYPYDRP